MSQLKGIDVSQFNEVDWDKLKADGIEFALIRASYGGGGKDAKFDHNWAEAKRVGIIREAYHFAYPGRSSGATQAHDFLNIVGKLEAGDGLMLDMEDEPVYGRRLVASDVGWAKEFLDTARDLTKVKPLDYINTDVKGRFDWSSIANEDFGLHQANYGANTGKPGTEPDPAPWKFNAIWQYTSKGVAGGSSPLDLDLFNGTREQLLKYGASGTVTPVVNAPAPAQPAPPVAQATYVVQKGEWLAKIADKFGTTWQALASANGLSHPDLIFEGQVLRVPGDHHETYTVQKGDALSKVFPANWQLVARLNGISNPDLIFPGQVLRLP
jgi:GH25 family lysozyme M1 (1,4-beta-N-acetylmuramidase)/LysM repeat protein